MELVSQSGYILMWGFVKDKDPWAWDLKLSSLPWPHSQIAGGGRGSRKWQRNHPNSCRVEGPQSTPLTCDFFPPGSLSPRSLYFRKPSSLKYNHRKPSH